jgi:hypothetical protein
VLEDALVRPPLCHGSQFVIPRLKYNGSNNMTTANEEMEGTEKEATNDFVWLNYSGFRVSGYNVFSFSMQILLK